MIGVDARVLDQAVRDEVLDRRVEVRGWQKQHERYEDELDNPRALALPDWATLTKLATTRPPAHRAHLVRRCRRAIALATRVAGHRDPRITVRYLHPDIKSLQGDGSLLSLHLRSATTDSQIRTSPLRHRSEGTSVCRADRI